jgi:hypothetical protein
MINALHLLWIVPLCISIAVVIVALCVAGENADERMDEIMRKMKDGDET